MVEDVYEALKGHDILFICGAPKGHDILNCEAPKGHEMLFMVDMI